MKHPKITHPTPRYDGWSPSRRACFLIGIEAGLPVGVVMQAVGMSRTAAYALARRDARFAAAWAAARAIAKPIPEVETWDFRDAEALSNTGLMARLHRANIGRGRRLINLRC